MNLLKIVIKKVNDVVVIEKSWDWPTLILYVLLAITIMFLSMASIKAKKQNERIKIKKINIEKKYIYYVMIYIVFILFSTFRVVSNGIGGTDTITYIEHFKNMKYVRFFSIANLTLNDFEYLYYNLMYVVKLCGGAYINFEFLIHSSIIISYIYIIDKCLNEPKSSVVVILFFIPLLKSLNIIRNCFAACLGCVGLEKVNENKKVAGVLLILAAFLSHYMAIVLFVFLLFNKFFPNNWINKKTEIFLPIVCLLMGELSLPIIKVLIDHSGFSGYLNKIQVSLLGYVPIITLYLVMIFTDDFKNYVIKNKHYVYFKAHIFMISILPITIMIGAASRVMLFFEIPKYILYSDLFVIYRNKINNKTAYDVIVILSLIIWLIFRIYRMWNGYGLMPYKNKLFNW